MAEGTLQEIKDKARALAEKQVDQQGAIDTAMAAARKARAAKINNMLMTVGKDTLIETPNPKPIDRNKELTTSIPNNAAPTEEVEEPAVEPVEGEEPVEDAPLTLQVNGRPVTRPTSEWLQLAAKVASGDEYFEAAAANLTRSSQVRQEPVVPELSDRELADALQMGNEDERAAAVRKLRQDATAEAKKALEQEQMQNRCTLIWQQFLKDFPDFATSPVLMAALKGLEKDVIANENKLGKYLFNPDFPTNFNMRLRHCAKQILDYRDGITTVAQKEVIKEDLETKKQGIHNLKTAGSKIAKKPAVQLTAEQINEMAINDMIRSRNKKKSASPVMY